MKKNRYFKGLGIFLAVSIILPFAAYIFLVFLPSKVETNSPKQWDLTQKQFETVKRNMLEDVNKMNAFYTITKQDPVKAKQWRDIGDQIYAKEY
jgi:hypothetical protein